ncbi:DEAD/DEAH box helicase [Paenibacillus sediminis]|uniref:Superfamily II DNA or RNA helicase n=1 Tax=Paenibacillus sediminis TaxID=664909 RepID=A0ABS4H0M9_9BACL|nr:DEAD/DEAH box helicase [Paenibacillus sediminis]MBP1936092.1 superfamily II DNA or RNA helicase [Paenibacillus sediminis]
MRFQLTKEAIRLLSGRFSYEDGEDLYQSGKVALGSADPETSIYEATVADDDTDYSVTVQMNQNENVDANCTCLEFDPVDLFCKHVAAVLLKILDIPVIEHRNMASTDASSGDKRLVSRMLQMFDDNRRVSTSSLQSIYDTRELLNIEFTMRPLPYGDRKYMFGIEMKTGVKRLYIVQRIREFLNQMDRREDYMFSRHFTYDPKLHRLGKEDYSIIQQLIQIYHNEQMYRETMGHYSFRINSTSGERILLIPPASWEALFPLLTDVPSVKIEQNGLIYEGIRFSDESSPLHLTFEHPEGHGYRLNVQGLDKMIVMEAYGLVLFEGKLFKLKSEECKQLSNLQSMLERSRKHHILIPADQMELFMEKGIPVLIKLGRVTISKAVSDRIVHTPLKARLYLDRVKDRLLASLEFQYGEIVMNPLEGAEHSRTEGQILMRDGELERRILELMDQGDFTKTESGYFLEDEDSEYYFLYHILPNLEKLVSVYATTAVKERIYTGHIFPKIMVDVDDRTDWLKFTFDMQGIPESDISKLLKSLDENRKFYRLPNGALLPLESEKFREIVSFMNEMGIRGKDVKGSEIHLPALNGLRLIDYDKQGNTITLGKSLRRFLENMRNPDNLDFPIPNSLENVLRDYQMYGYQWMKTLAHYRFGGILADDMGLGKTLQSIAFIVSELPEIRNLKKPAMIVCPASLLYNWRNELSKFAPEIRTVIADGNKVERSKLLRDLSQADVLITSYPLLRIDIELYADQSFYILILDEAQTFKNHYTQTAQVVKMIQARYRFALTGTPVENRLEELWSIYNTVFPELFPERKEFNELPRELVAKRSRPFLLRRLKMDVLKELPGKIESIQSSELLPDQKKLYAAYLAKLKQETLKLLNDDTFEKNRIKILAGLTRLRQLCCHPALFVEGYTGSSAKFAQLLEIVEECLNTGKRILVFSQFTKMLGLIGRELGRQGVPYFYLDGSTPSSERVELGNRFNAGEKDVFLISLKAGGTGLNLTGADTVILYDLWWNPAVEQQAADRAHRIGQKNVVQVIRLVAHGTVEEKMYELQQKKKNLIEEVIESGQEAISSLTENEIREILMI